MSASGITGVKLREAIAYPTAYDVGNISNLTADIIYFVLSEIIISLFALAIWYEQKPIKDILRYKLSKNPQITSERYVKLGESNQISKPLRAIFIIFTLSAVWVKLYSRKKQIKAL